MHEKRQFDAQKVKSRHDFEIKVDPKVPPSESNFWLVRGHTHFPAKTGPKNQNRKISTISLISHDQSTDNSLLIQKLIEIGQKMFAHINSERIS